MKRVACVIVVAAGCSNILGLTPPKAAPIDAPIDSVAVDSPVDAAIGFSLKVTNPHPRVPAGGFDFLDVQITRDGFDGPITLDVPDPPQGVTVIKSMIGSGETTGELKLAGTNQLTIGAPLAVDVVGSAGSLSADDNIVVTVTLIPGSADPTFNGSGVAGYAIGSVGSFCSDLEIAPDGETSLFGTTIAGSVDGGIVRIKPNGAGNGVFNAVHSDQGDPDPATFDCGTIGSDGTTAVAGGKATDSRSDFVDAAWIAGFNFVGAPVKPFGDINGFDFVEPFSLVAGLKRDAANHFVMLVTGPNTSEIVLQDAGGSTVATTSLDLQHVTSAASLALDGSGASYYIVGEGPLPLQADHVSGSDAVDAAFGSAADAALAVVATAVGSAGFEGSGAGSGAAVIGGDAVTVTADGSLLIAGRPGYLAKLHADGTLDTTFGTAGVTAIGSFTAVAGIGVQSDGKILVAGTSGKAVVVRLTPQGALDPTYATNSIATTKLDVVSAIRIQADDNAILCGTLANQFGAARQTF
jgi:uncharacterized delta-60 repeat protein|nr:hypothetical protein [Kofleriaceae bacterium]